MNSFRRILLVTGSSVALLSGLVFPSFAGEATEWRWQNPLPQGNHLNSAAWTGDSWIAVGNFGTIVTSSNGESWSVLESPTERSLHAVKWTGDEAVAAGNGVFLRSADGTNWSAVSIDGDNDSASDLYAIARSGERFVAAGYDFSAEEGVVFTSEEGNVWSRIDLPGLEETVLRDAVWTGDGFVVVGGKAELPPGGGVSLTSADGLNWDPAWEFPDGNFTSVVRTGNRLVAVALGSDGAFRRNLLCSSADGKNWEIEKILENSSETELHASDDRIGFVSSGSHSSFVGTVFISQDDWEVNARWLSELPLRSLAWNGSQWLAAGVRGGLFRSPDMENWMELSSSRFRENFRDIVRGEDRFVAVGDEGVVAVSADGRHWTRAVVPYHDNVYFDRDLRQVVWTGERFFAISRLGSFFSSTDGLVWNFLGSRRIGTMRAEWAGDSVLVIGSTRGGTLTPMIDAGRALVNAVWTGERIIGIAQNEYGGPDDLLAAVRQPGGSWETHEFGRFGWGRALGWNGSEALLLLETDDGLLAARSVNGLDWEIDPITSGPEDFPYRSQRLHWIEERWWLPQTEARGDWRDSQGVLWTSPNGLEWEKERLPADHVSKIAWSGNTVAAVGNRGMILTSAADSAPAGHTLLVGGLPGSIHVEPSLSSYPPGAVVEATAIPPPGYEFIEWAGDVSGNDKTITLVMDSPKAISARFRLEGATDGYHLWVDPLHETDGTKIAPMADFNSDGIVNLLKYVGDIDIADSSGRQLGNLEKPAGLDLRYRVTLRVDQDLIYGIEHSDDLDRWSKAELRHDPDEKRWIFNDPEDVFHSQIAFLGVNHWQFMRVTLTAPEDEELPRFFRLRVSLR